MKFRPLCGTWSAVLLTPLSVTGDVYYGRMKFKGGETYWQYLLSVPPGTITRALGIERPIEGTHGPAWEMRYGIGGTHAMVVPYMNFSTPGVFFVLFLYGFFTGKLERLLMTNTQVNMQLLYASIFIAAPFWFWYGEMSLIRALMSFYIVWIIYKFMPKIRIA